MVQVRETKSVEQANKENIKNQNLHKQDGFKQNLDKMSPEELKDYSETKRASALTKETKPLDPADKWMTEKKAEMNAKDAEVHRGDHEKSMDPVQKDVKAIGGMSTVDSIVKESGAPNEKSLKEFLQKSPEKSGEFKDAIQNVKNACKKSPDEANKAAEQLVKDSLKRNAKEGQAR